MTLNLNLNAKMALCKLIEIAKDKNDFEGMVRAIEIYRYIKSLEQQVSKPTNITLDICLAMIGLVLAALIWFGYL